MEKSHYSMEFAHLPLEAREEPDQQIEVDLNDPARIQRVEFIASQVS